MFAIIKEIEISSLHYRIGRECLMLYDVAVTSCQRRLAAKLKFLRCTIVSGRNAGCGTRHSHELPVGAYRQIEMGCDCMNLTYRKQTALAVLIIIFANIFTEAFGIWIYRSMGFCVCGLMWIIHPVLPSNIEENEKTIHWARIAGVILILIGIFTRVHY